MITFFILIGMTAPLAVLSFVVGALAAGIDHETTDASDESPEHPRWVSIV